MVQLRQAIFEAMMELEEGMSVRHSKGATLFINPTNGFGMRIKPVDDNGVEVKVLHREGPYPSAADEYDLC